MIDWSALVADSALNLPRNEAKAPCSDLATRNKPHKPENVGTPETLAVNGFHVFCSDVPSVPHVIERPRVEEHENNNPSSFTEPVGGGVEGLSAPHSKAVETSCKNCAHLGRPGLSDGHCGGREDLPPAYGPGHPLRQLPTDYGASCSSWALHPYL